jgi:hypothetical protein
METSILLLIARHAPRLAASTKTMSMVVRVRWRRCAARERVEPRNLILRKVIRSRIGAIAWHVLHLVGLLLGSEHHLLISPLC